MAIALLFRYVSSELFSTLSDLKEENVSSHLREATARGSTSVGGTPVSTLVGVDGFDVESHPGEDVEKELKTTGAGPQREMSLSSSPTRPVRWRRLMLSMAVLCSMLHPAVAHGHDGYLGIRVGEAMKPGPLHSMDDPDASAAEDYGSDDGAWLAHPEDVQEVQLSGLDVSSASRAATHQVSPSDDVQGSQAHSRELQWQRLEKEAGIKRGRDQQRASRKLPEAERLPQTPTQYDHPCTSFQGSRQGYLFTTRATHTHWLLC